MLDDIKLPSYEPTFEEAFTDIQNEDTPLDALSRQELAFLLGYIKTGDASASARAVGYSVQMSLLAASLLDKPHIRKALRGIRATQRETLRQRQINSAGVALGVVQEIISSPDANHAVRLQAACKLIDISGTIAPKEMSDELQDDAPMEKVAHNKMSLAFKEAGETNKL